MLIDCNQCVMKDTGACGDCVVTHVLHDPAVPLEIDDEQADALALLAEEGMVPVLRLLPRSAAG